MRIDGQRITHFDFKAMDVDGETDPEGIKQAVKLIVDALKDEEDVIAAFLSLQREIRNRGEEILPFTRKLTKALLSLGDYFNALDNHSIKRAFASALIAGQSKEVREAILEATERSRIKGFIAGITGIPKREILERLGVKEDEIVKIEARSPLNRNT